MANAHDELCPPPTDDDDLTLPRASINKMIKELVSTMESNWKYSPNVIELNEIVSNYNLQVPSIRVANESRELILNCCTEFIHLISSEANEVCNTRNKKTINAEHVLEALDRLGFKDYKQDAEAVLNDCKAVAAKRRRQSTRLENLGIPEEELFRQQQELFAKARQEQQAADQAQWMSFSAAVQQNAPLTDEQQQLQQRHIAAMTPSANDQSAQEDACDSDDDDDDDY